MSTRKTIGISLIVLAAFACTKESHTPKTELSCQWNVMESYPEQVSGECAVDTSKDSLEIPLADIPPLPTTFVIEINGKTLDPSMVQLDAEKKLVTVGPLSSDLKKGTVKIRYTADRTQETKTSVATVINGENVAACSFLLELPGGTKLQPMELKKEFQTDGLAVTISYREHPELASTCQAGMLVELLTIERR